MVHTEYLRQDRRDSNDRIKEQDSADRTAQTGENRQARTPRT